MTNTLSAQSPDVTSASSVDRTFLAGASRQLAVTAEPTPTAKPNPAVAKAKPAAAPAVAELPRTGVPGHLPVTGRLLIPVGAALTYRFRSVRPATR